MHGEFQGQDAPAPALLGLFGRRRPVGGPPLGDTPSEAPLTDCDVTGAETAFTVTIDAPTTSCTRPGSPRPRCTWLTKAKTHVVNSKAKTHWPLLSLASAVLGAPLEAP